MIAFSIKILENYGDKSFLVEYKPADESLTTHTNRIYLDIDSTVTKEQVIEKLKAAAPSDLWKHESVNNSMDLSHLNDLKESVVNVEETPEVITPVVTSNETHISTPEQIRLYQEVQMEAAVQRVLARLVGERI